MGDDYELLMPFVTVASKGGPHDDQAYVAGWEMGKLAALLGDFLRPSGEVIEQTIRTDNLPQADLIAMQHGFKLESRSDPDFDEWTHIHLTHLDGSDDARPA